MEHDWEAWYDGDSDTDEELLDPSSFDGGYDRGSYFHQAMQKEDRPDVPADLEEERD